ncbi:MAG: glycoside hydrolase family 3 C-terminal domain-containing protein [Thermotogota bacterium]|nr:glycoside hydrolase family 3 C-terminal domain-containing protein [Thermotogota bacterium]
MEAYKDKNNSIDDRVEDLIQRMTLDEKIAQLTSIWSYEVFSNGNFSGEKADKKIKNGIGQITRPGGATFLEPRDLGAFINQFQEYLVKNTRLGIPAMIHEECLCGYLTKNATMFPEMIGLASAWDEGLVEEVAGAIRDELKTVNAHQVPISLNSKEHRDIALKAAEKSIVLLKNEDNLLPLSAEIKKIAVIGPTAADGRNQLGDYSYPAHMESLMDKKEEDHFGSPAPDFEESNFSVQSVVNVLEGINNHKPENLEVLYQKGCSVIGDDADIEAAVQTASEADTVILCLGDKSGLIPNCTTGEARDSMTLELTGRQLELAKAILKTGKPVISVIISGRPYNLSIFEEGSKAILQAWLPGEEGGNAIAKALFGKFNPSGKLPISFPRHVGQIPVYYNHKASGQRSHWFGDYVDGSPKPLYPFGYGLSYTTFDYSDLSIPKEIQSDMDEIDISFSIKNTGNYDGEEIVQLYVNDPAASVTRPVKELKGFGKVSLKQGEQKKLHFKLPVELLAFFNNEMKLVVEPGLYHIMIGQSSENIVLEQEITLKGKIKAIGKRNRYSSILLDD